MANGTVVSQTECHACANLLESILVAMLMPVEWVFYRLIATSPDLEGSVTIDRPGHVSAEARRRQPELFVLDRRLPPSRSLESGRSDLLLQAWRMIVEDMASDSRDHFLPPCPIRLDVVRMIPKRAMGGIWKASQKS